jgi:hypothetical protein
MTVFLKIISLVLILIILGFLIKRGLELTEFFDETPPIIEELKREVSRVHPKCAEMKIVKGNKSYTVNKKKIYLCLYDKKTGELYNKNMLVYVLLHELAHVLNEGNADPAQDIGHTEAFHAVFDKLLDRAEELGVYDPDVPLVDKYCE